MAEHMDATPVRGSEGKAQHYSADGRAISNAHTMVSQSAQSASGVPGVVIKGISGQGLVSAHGAVSQSVPAAPTASAPAASSGATQSSSSDSKG